MINEMKNEVEYKNPSVRGGQPTVLMNMYPDFHQGARMATELYTQVE